ncbi:hypothetical protein BLOT_015943 [Blomia tropicalis]|nr:hypothetical protein BLOT_015943 [Blomia tropicalis]
METLHKTYQSLYKRATFCPFQPDRLNFVSHQKNYISPPIAASTSHKVQTERPNFERFIDSQQYLEIQLDETYEQLFQNHSTMNSYNIITPKSISGHQLSGSQEQSRVNNFQIKESKQKPKINFTATSQSTANFNQGKEASHSKSRSDYYKRLEYFREYNRKLKERNPLYWKRDRKVNDQKETKPQKKKRTRDSAAEYQKRLEYFREYNRKLKERNPLYWKRDGKRKQTDKQ